MIAQLTDRAADQRGQHAELGLGQVLAVKASVAISSETVNPMPADRAAAEHRHPADRRADPAAAELGHQRRPRR